MKYSRQRELIYQTVLETHVHPTADLVYQLVREQLPTISLGTVYRNLNLLSEQGQLRKISLPSQPDHFDGRLEDHQHILCEKCAKVFDIPLPESCDWVRLLDDHPDFTVTGCTVHLTGICPACREQS